MAAPLRKRFPSGMVLLLTSVVTRVGVLLLLCGIAWNTIYINFKVAHNNARLVELSAGSTTRFFYERAEAFFGLFGDPLLIAQSSGGMTWSIRLMGVPFTDPIAALTVLSRGHGLELGFALGLLVPLLLALLFGRVFCSYICPASLLFFTIGRLRRACRRFLLLPEITLNRGVAWGLLLGGLGATWLFGQGLWALLLPYLAVGHTLFQGLAFGVLSAGIGAILVFALLDMVFGSQFTCRNLCPTGRLLGAIGSRPLVRLHRHAPACPSRCNSCATICPMGVNPRADETRDCSLCGECLVVCPVNCLHVGVKSR